MSLDWLLTGDGPMYRTKEKSSPVTDTHVNILGIQRTSGNAQNSTLMTYTNQQLLDQIERLQNTINTLLATNAKLVDKLTSI